MTNEDEQRKERKAGRRTEDVAVRDRISKHELLFDVGQIITSEMDLNTLFEVIIAQTNKIMDTQRSTVYLHDEASKELWSLVATGMERNEIRMPSDNGIVGWVFQKKEPLIINDVYSDPRFYSQIDKKTGFHSKNTLCMPLINRTGI
ncbi:MAG: GAF domain-containing protein, partial [Desulfobacterales bacterium]